MKYNSHTLYINPSDEIRLQSATMTLTFLKLEWVYSKKDKLYHAYYVYSDLAIPAIWKAYKRVLKIKFQDKRIIPSFYNKG